MIRSLWIAKTGLDAQQTNLDVISNNLANVSTNGFKRQRAVLKFNIAKIIRQPGAMSSEQTSLPSGYKWERVHALLPPCVFMRRRIK